jgi:hypothetical protein
VTEQDERAVGRSGVLVVRAWWYEGRLIARVQWYVSGETQPRVQAVAGSDGLNDATQDWLRTLTGEKNSATN